MDYLEAIDVTTAEFGDLYDELPLWSAHFGMMLLDQVALRPGMTILDVGAGTGFLTVELAQRCGAAARVIAVDPWAAAMQRLERKARHIGLTNVRTVVEDAAAVELADESVDLIVSNLGVNNFGNAEAVLRMCHRAAKPGAGLYLTTNLVGHMGEFYDVFRGVLEDLGGGDRLAALDAHVNHRATVGSVTTQLERAGFEVVRTASSSFRERFVDGSALLRHYFIRLAFVQGWKGVAAGGRVEETFAELERRLNAVAAERGGLALTIPAACVEARKRGGG